MMAVLVVVSTSTHISSPEWGAIVPRKDLIGTVRSPVGHKLNVTITAAAPTNSHPELKLRDFEPLPVPEASHRLTTRNGAGVIFCSLLVAL